MRLLMVFVLGVVLAACGGAGSGGDARVPDIPEFWVDVVPEGGVLVTLEELSDELQDRVHAATAATAFVNVQLVLFRGPLGDLVLLVSAETIPVAIADNCLVIREFSEREFWALDCPA